MVSICLFFLSSFLSFFALCLGGLVKGRNLEQQPFSSNTLENNNRKSVSEPLVNGTGILALEQVRSLLSGIVLRPRPPPIVNGNADHSNQNHCRNRDNHVKTSTGNASLCQKRGREGSVIKKGEEEEKGRQTIATRSGSKSSLQ